MKCFYHTDMDGHCAGAIVAQAMSDQENDGTGFEYIAINYNHQFPFGEIKPNEEVVIVDFSLQKPGDFEKLLEITKRVIWIDHHKTAIEKWKHLDGNIEGIRRDGVAACELTWEYFYPDEPIPPVVELLGDYDIWAFKHGDATNYLQAGIKLNDTKPESGMWAEWLDPEYYPDREIKEGKVALQYRDNYYAELIKSWAFFTTFEGYKVIACNAGSVSSQLFDTVKEDYDIMMPFVFDGKRWTVSVYTKKSDIDCSELAKKYGGGGHRQAAGFQCDQLPFSQNKQQNSKKQTAEAVKLSELLASFLCFIGIHRWQWETHKSFAIGSSGVRICKRCGKKQRWLQGGIDIYFYNI